MNYRTRIVTSLSQIGQPAWDALLATQTDANPFLSFAFLHALHESGSAAADTGWQPQFLTLWRAGGAGEPDSLEAALPLYVKSHSYGEYVFDWAWADAYQRNGLAYYPKLLGAIPFSPVTGPRLLAGDAATRALLVRAAIRLARETSSLHVLFPTEPEAREMEAAGNVLRPPGPIPWGERGYASFGGVPAWLASPPTQ